MKIGFFSETFLPRNDGVAYSMETFRQYLESQGHEVYVFAPKFKKFGFREPSTRIFRYPALKNYFIDDHKTGIFYPPLAVKKVEKLNLDLIHFHTPSPIGLLGAYVATKNNIPLVSTWHTDMYEYVAHYPELFPGILALALVAPLAIGGDRKDFQTALSMMRPETTIDAWNKKIVRRMITVVHNRCDLLISPSLKIKNQLQSWDTHSPIEILPTGVDEITTKSEEIYSFKKRFGIAHTDKVLLFVGRIGTEKNVGLLLDSLPLIIARHPQTKLVMVGDGSHRKELAIRAKELGVEKNIVFTGYIDRQQLGAAYHAADIFTFPSLSDTQGLVLHEAALSGLPIVMIDREVSEVMQEGINGFFASNHPDDFAAKINRLLGDEKAVRDMGQASVELALEFSSSKQGAKLLRLYQEVCEKHYAKPEKKPRVKKIRDRLASLRDS